MSEETITVRAGRKQTIITGRVKEDDYILGHIYREKSVFVFGHLTVKSALKIAAGRGFVVDDPEYPLTIGHVVTNLPKWVVAGNKVTPVGIDF